MKPCRTIYAEICKHYHPLPPKIYTPLHQEFLFRNDGSSLFKSYCWKEENKSLAILEFFCLPFLFLCRVQEACLTWMTKLSRPEYVGKLGNVPVVWVIWEEDIEHCPLILIRWSVCVTGRQEWSFKDKIRDNKPMALLSRVAVRKGLQERRNKASL